MRTGCRIDILIVFQQFLYLSLDSKATVFVFTLIIVFNVGLVSFVQRVFLKCFSQ
jgi:hypothetical protein